MASQGKNKTNFKTYEASTRLLAAVIATTNVKLDYAGKRIYLTYLTLICLAALDLFPARVNSNSLLTPSYHRR